MALGLSLKNITKTFGDFKALSEVSFDIPPGQFVTLLGPSGCGKTTLLRIIAGFLEPDEGEVLFDQTVMNDIPPNKRNTAMCFQSYALFPHKTVYENIRFGLRMRKVPQEEHHPRIEEAMAMVNLTGLEHRKPYELSGGQQQRVALARSVVVRPEILLFDEPLSNLDAKLREKVRVEIRDLQKKLGITTIYVTHDQAEALAISDLIVAMKSGTILQNSHPRTIYDQPSSKFIADFIGSANIVPCTVKRLGGSLFSTESPYGTLRAEDQDFPRDQGEAFLCIRPEDVRPALAGEDTSAMNLVNGVVENSVYMGSMLDLRVTVKDHFLQVNVSKDYLITVGARIDFTIPPAKIRLLES
ncbi:spermidine/putrescine import ATP-binding protein PotA [Treponema primitia ZAS-2]|uniref:Spermidine/putrescine import ATP-binding protein PotA n=1 Tax=Treponema primitia (strain ATCC BAA-887 / DSM 12427 / ZAS-2) TaxID=545694 RepID=F5YNB0_TREPZ|nr:ABC transporter ATP-binding protein [Treponema primitia]AEF85361.1 spermidine/putrescine import ATP-binding protein PotA [Treponema primitia ZAS-2]